VSAAALCLWFVLGGSSFGQEPVDPPPAEEPAPEETPAPAEEAPEAEELVPGLPEPEPAADDPQGRPPTVPVGLDLTAAPLDPEYEAPHWTTGKVSAVRISGNRRIEEAAILAALQLRVGDTVTPEKVRRDIDSVHRTGFFQDVRVFRETDSAGGLILIFQVEENPAVREVRVEGNKKVNEEDVLEVIDVGGFTVLNDAEVALNARRVRDLYLEKGYFLVEVEPETREVGTEIVDLTFRITENRKVVVQTIDVTGNEYVETNRWLPWLEQPVVSDRKAQRYMGQKTGGILPWFTSQGNFSQVDLDNDLYVLRSVMLEHGFVDAQVHEPKVYLSPDKRYISISIHVDEGPRYRVGKIDVQGDWVPSEGLTRDAAMRLIAGETVAEVQEFPDGQPTNVWHEFVSITDALMGAPEPLISGEWFQLSRLQVVLGSIADLYGDQGYAFTSVVPLTETDPETGVVDITFDVQKGEKVSIGQINITGNDPTFDKTVRREIPISEGEIYQGSALREARQRLERTGFFETVRISTPRGSAPDVLDMNVEVVEQPTGSFSVGAGFSSVDQFVFTGNISKNNWLGLGYVMSAAVNWSVNRQQGNLSFADPHLMDSRWTLNVDAYSMNTQYYEDTYRRGAGIGIGRYLDEREDLRLNVSYNLEDVGLTSITAYQKRLLGGQMYRNGLTSIAGISLVVDKRNNRIHPTKGFYGSLQVSLAGGFVVNEKLVTVLGGEFNFAETKLNIRGFYPILPNTDRVVFKFNSTLGWIKSTDGTVVPYIHRYRAGGIKSVRGYNWYSLGPTIRNLGSEDPTRADDRLIVGGTEIWVNNFEIEVQLIPDAGISGVVFFDAGNAFGDPYGVGHMSISGMRFGYGFGIRWFSPIGPLRFELGFPVNPYPDERKSVFDFSIGSFF